MDIQFDFKGDPVGGLVSNCKSTYTVQSIIIMCV